MKDRKREYRRRCLEKGLCVTCGTRPIKQGYKSNCQHCLLISRENTKKRLVRLRASNLCTACGKVPPTENKRLCEECRHKRAATTEIKKLKKRCDAYGITVDDYRDMYHSQNGKCAICRRPPNGRWNELAIDHCHSTGYVRGLLCSSCNKAVGCFQDDPEIIKTAAEYVSRSIRNYALVM